MEIKQNDVVTFKPEWQDKGDDKFTWWMQATGKPLACEAGCTKHPARAGVEFDPRKAGVA